jgi:hypothetical protein
VIKRIHISNAGLFGPAVWLLAVLGVPVAAPLFGQTGAAEDPIELDRDHWKDLTAPLDYRTEAPVQEPQKKRPPLFGPESYQVMRILLILVAAVLLALLLRAIILANRQAKDRKLKGRPTVIELEQLEDQLEEADIRTPLKKAVREGQYGLAVRLYYLIVLQALSRQQWIRWKREKTNAEYQRELIGAPFADRFTKLTGLFERIWYGDQRVDEKRFEAIQVQFQQLLSRIEQAGTPKSAP